MRTLKSEIAQSKPFETLCQETALSLLKTADAIHRAYTEAMQSFDITFQQYNVLRIVRGAGEAGIPTTLIAERMIKHNPGVTRLIDRLERKKLLKRKRSKTDRRVVICHATDVAVDLLDTMQDAVRDAERQMMQGIEEKDLQFAIGLLGQLREGMRQDA